MQQGLAVIVGRDDQDGGPDLERRFVLAVLAAACLTGKLPLAEAQPANEGLGAFVSISRFLTGRVTLDPAQSARHYQAFTRDSPQFGADLQKLLAWIGERKIGPGELQITLDAEAFSLSGLPRQILTAWYTGVVGEGGAARCITFETSLMHQVVADRLTPPSYCFGPHGSWADAPV